jgi:urease accessory protein
MSGPSPAAEDLLAVAQLLRLASPALPIGAFAWSGGLESAIDEGLVRDAASAQRWLHDLIAHAHGRWDAPLLWTLLTEPARRAELNARHLASRETHELRSETLQTGASLLRLLTALEPGMTPVPSPSLPLAWALAAETWRVRPEAALLGWLVAALENQLAVLQKALPLGQVGAQRLFSALLPTIATTHTQARALPEHAWSSHLPGLASLSARHEHQYSRLFRS